ncbi:MAG TPA: hypothetical protein PKN75_15135 [Bacteroidia bacterium]|nr:hypothetical protein [Bacteroidia bacterium]HNU34919.1 hypothetical protein [Bacteroidia bacterium]
MNNIKNFIFFLLACILIYSCKRKPYPDGEIPVPEEISEFQNSYSSLDDEIPYSVIHTSDNCYVITGSTNTLSNGEYDMYLAKIDSAGNLLWRKSIGGAALDGGFDVIETPGNTYLSVGFSKSFNFTNGYEVYVVKTDAAGNNIWQKTFGGYNNDCAKNIILSKDNDGYIITGGTNGSLIQLGNQAYIAKFNFNGDSLWTKSYDTPYSEIGKSICYDSNGNLMILASPGSHYSGNNLLTLYCNSNADTITTKTIGGSNREDAGEIIPSGNDFILCATTLSYNDPNGDVYLSKIHADGTTIWEKIIDTGYPDIGNSIIQTSDNYLLIAGATTDSLNFSRALLIKTDLNGNLIWKKTFGNSANYIANKVIETPIAYILTGTKQDSIGSYDAFVFKIKK